MVYTRIGTCKIIKIFFNAKLISEVYFFIPLSSFWGPPAGTSGGLVFPPAVLSVGFWPSLSSRPGLHRGDQVLQSLMSYSGLQIIWKDCLPYQIWQRNLLFVAISWIALYIFSWMGFTSFLFVFIWKDLPSLPKRLALKILGFFLGIPRSPCSFFFFMSSGKKNRLSLEFLCTFLSSVGKLLYQSSFLPLVAELIKLGLGFRKLRNIILGYTGCRHIAKFLGFPQWCCQYSAQTSKQKFFSWLSILKSNFNSPIPNS